MIESNEQMSARESLEHEWYIEEARQSREHAIVMKRLDLEEQKLEAKWASWIRIPLTIVKLPVYVVMAFGYVVGMAAGREVPDKFWDYLK